jgi:regulator of protease activity HflC (stomatin/prohibitin superfamily)
MERDRVSDEIKKNVDTSTGGWGINVLEIKIQDIELPADMKRAMAKEAEALREKRARLIKAAAEQEASIKLSEASKTILQNPLALELRRMQMLTEIGAENNTTTVVMIPSDLITLARHWSAPADRPSSKVEDSLTESRPVDSDQD